MGVGFPFGMMKCSKMALWWWLHNSVNVLKTTELLRTEVGA